MSQDIPHDTNVRALITCMTIAVLFVVTRSGVRWYKLHTFQMEDFVCWFATASYITMSGLYLRVLPILYMSQDVTSGRILPPEDMFEQIRTMMHVFFAIQLLFWATLWSVKFSLLWMFRGLIVGLPVYNKIWTGIVVFTALSFLGCLVSQLKSCSTVAAYFEPGACSSLADVSSQAASLYYSLAVDVLTDILIASIPIRLIWGLQINRIEKISIGLTFCVGLVTILCAVIRVISLSATTKGSSASQIQVSWLSLWATIEGLVAIVVCCLPALAIFIRGRFSQSRSQYGTGYYAQQQSSSRNPHTSANIQARGESLLLDEMDLKRTRVGQLYPKAGFHMTTVTVGNPHSKIDGGSEESSINRSYNNEGYITRTVDVVQTIN